MDALEAVVRYRQFQRSDEMQQRELAERRNYFGGRAFLEETIEVQLSYVVISVAAGFLVGFSWGWLVAFLLGLIPPLFLPLYQFNRFRIRFERFTAACFCEGVESAGETTGGLDSERLARTYNGYRKVQCFFALVAIPVTYWGTVSYLFLG